MLQSLDLQRQAHLNTSRSRSNQIFQQRHQVSQIHLLVFHNTKGWYQTQLYTATGGEQGLKLLQSPASTIAERVARHVDSIYAIIDGFGYLGTTRGTFNYFDNSLIRQVYPDLPLDYVPETAVEVGGFEINGIPSFKDIFVEGVANYLKPLA